MNIFVLGSGAWGTALALLLVHNGHTVTLWSHSAQRAADMAQSRLNPALAGLELPKELNVTADISQVAQADMLLVVTTSQVLRSRMELAAPYIQPKTVIVSATKGIEAETELRMSQIIAQLAPACSVAALSGPSHAEEVSRQKGTGCVVACPDKAVAELVQKTFMTAWFRVYINDDIVGVELCGALKNIIALGCGILDGLELGDNAKALFMTRSMSEIASLSKRMGGQRKTCSGLAGMGDLIVTCCSGHSRNRQAGLLIGGGTSVPQALEQVGAVVEGYYAAASAHKLGQDLQVELPICESVYRILYEEAPAYETLAGLMTRQGRSEFDFSWGDE
jgi:glycerol-3-phosphate dehydrogenase (NAD(P)+)